MFSTCHYALGATRYLMGLAPVRVICVSTNHSLKADTIRSYAIYKLRFVEIHPPSLTRSGTSGRAVWHGIAIMHCVFYHIKITHQIRVMRIHSVESFI